MFFLSYYYTSFIFRVCPVSPRPVPFFFCQKVGLVQLGCAASTTHRRQLLQATPAGDSCRQTPADKCSKSAASKRNVLHEKQHRIAPYQKKEVARRCRSPRNKTCQHVLIARTWAAISNPPQGIFTSLPGIFTLKRTKMRLHAYCASKIIPMSYIFLSHTGRQTCTCNMPT